VKGLSNGLMQLRKICQHPFLFDSVEDKINPGGMIDDKIHRVAVAQSEGGPADETDVRRPKVR